MIGDLERVGAYLAEKEKARPARDFAALMSEAVRLQAVLDGAEGDPETFLTRSDFEWLEKQEAELRRQAKKQRREFQYFHLYVNPYPDGALFWRDPRLDPQNPYHVYLTLPKSLMGYFHVTADQERQAADQERQRVEGFLRDRVVRQLCAGRGVDYIAGGIKRPLSFVEGIKDRLLNDPAYAAALRIELRSLYGDAWRARGLELLGEGANLKGRD